ncbi:MAG: CvpA family protein [Lachnospiraceae bacterium]|nr:CvpA family protein [Lachnospiraceae bacterium]
MNWVLLVCIAILVVLGLVGLKLGVVKMLYHLASFTLALILTALIAPPIAKTFVKNDSPRMERTKEKVVKTLHLNDIDYEKINFDELLEKVDMPESVKDELKVFNTSDVYKTMGAENAKDYIATSIAAIVLQALVYIVVFVLVWLLVFLVFQTINLIGKVPGLRVINRLAGMTVGILMGACVIFLFFVLVTALSSMPVGREMMHQINDNSVLRFWYDNNPLNGGFAYLSSIVK